MLLKNILNKVNFRPSRVDLRFFYDARTKNDTIFAPASYIQPGKGSPLAVVRVSGSKTEQALQQLTKLNCLRYNDTTLNSQHSTNKRVIRPRHATLSKIFDPIKDELIDIGMVVWFPKPKSYTGDDVCEFHLHGSQAIIKRIMNILGSMNGLRPAEAGEFTRRAVINGKMSLAQAESLPDLIASQTDFQRKLALSGLDGGTRRKYDSWSETLMNILAHLEASIDFGEEDLVGEKNVFEECVKKLNILAEEISQYIKISSQRRDLIQYGFRAVILGRPNAGKSTFMNLLCGKEKSIVSDLSGTTRDVVEHSFEFGGHAITLCDTAGLKDLTSHSPISNNDQISSLLNGHDMIEREGIKRALQVARNADVVLYLVDGSRLTGEEIELNGLVSELCQVLKLLENNNAAKIVHLIINKVDLNERLLCDKTVKEFEEMLEQTSSVKGSFISCLTQKNFNEFAQILTDRLNRLTSISKDSEVVQAETKLPTGELNHVNERHLSLLKAAEKHLRQSSRLSLESIDEMAQHVRESLDYLSRIVGSVTNEQVVDIIFRDFCIGK